MAKYYISNNIMFIQGLGNTMVTPSSASQFKRNEAVKYLNLHPDHVLIPCGKGKRNNTYIISTTQKYLGANNNVVFSMRDAKVFSSPKEAFDFIDNNQKLLEGFGETFVIDEKFKRSKRNIKVITEPQPVAETEPQNSSKRIRIPRSQKQALFKNSDMICPICGLPINESDVTVDHILPVSRGGTNVDSNLRLVHHNCNQLKGNFTDDELCTNVTNVCANMLYYSPTSDMSMRIIRNIVRGTIAQYQK